MKEAIPLERDSDKISIGCLRVGIGDIVECIFSGNIGIVVSWEKAYGIHELSRSYIHILSEGVINRVQAGYIQVITCR
jgi:hypothetical protein